MADAELLRGMGPELEVLLPGVGEEGRGAGGAAAGRGGEGAAAGGGGGGAGGGGWRGHRGGERDRGGVADGRGRGGGAGVGGCGAGGGGGGGGGGGDGGVTAGANVTGAGWQTVADGAAELGSGDVVPAGRVRRPGGGRKKLADTDPGLVPALLALVEDSTRGDPGSPLLWTTKSAVKLSGALTAAGHRCSPQTCWRLLGEQGFSTQSNARVAEGKQHAGRDAQFRHIAAQARGYLAAGDPVISVDAKKKEQVGEFAQAGREWRPAGDPVKTRSHDFPDDQGGHAIPYGVYDVGANTGFVNVGTGGNTAALAVESVRRWWQLAGKDAYPDAGRLLVTCDAGGSNGWRNRGWKAGMAELAAQTGLEITVCHFPPGTSKWNKIEHRLFSQITPGWPGPPPTSYGVIISTIGAVTTTTGLTVTAALDHNPHPTGTKISSAVMHDIEDRALTRHPFHGEWNYTLTPAPAPPPSPPPPPPPPRGAPRRSRARPPAPGRPPGPAALLATILRHRLALPLHVLAYLLGVSTDTITPAIRQTTGLLAQQDITITPGPRLTTLAAFRDYAAAAGITIPDPPRKQPHAPARNT